MRLSITKNTPIAKVVDWFKHDGRIYYSKDFERKLLFYLTVFMLIAGILNKFNII